MSGGAVRQGGCGREGLGEGREDKRGGAIEGRCVGEGKAWRLGNCFGLLVEQLQTLCCLEIGSRTNRQQKVCLMLWTGFFFRLHENYHIFVS